MAKQARILVDVYLEGQIYTPDQVVEFDDKIAKFLAQEGRIDLAREAVLYCVDALGAKPVKHAAAGQE